MGRSARCPSGPRGGIVHRSAFVRKGYPAFIVNPAGSASSQIFKVQVGRCMTIAARPNRWRGGSRRKRSSTLDLSLAALSGVLLALSFPKFGAPASAWLALTPLLVALARDVAFRLHIDAPSSLVSWLERCACCRDAVLARRDDDHVRRPCAAAGGRRRQICWSPTCLFFRRSLPSSSSGSFVFLDQSACSWHHAGLGCERTRTPVCLGRFSVGASGLQPGYLAADRAAGERGRGLRTFGASCAVGIRGRAGDSRPGSAASCAGAGRRCVHPSARRVLGTLGQVANGGLGVDARRASRCGVAVLQGNVEQGQKWDPRLVDEISERYLAMSREALAGGATFILWPESSTPYSSSATSPGAAPSAGSRIRDRRPSSWEAIRSSRSRSLDRGETDVSPLQRRLSGEAGRSRRRCVSEDAPRAVRRARPAQAAVVLRRAHRPKRRGFHAWPGPDAAAGRIATWRARRSATR